MDRLSSCSLDSVIGYLDQLLARNKETVDGVVMRSASPTQGEPKDETDGRKTLSPSSDRVRSNFANEEEECIQRVMDLSFASVYEMPASSNVGHSMMPVRSVIGCQKVMTVLSESLDPPESLDSGVESNKSDDECQTNGSHSPVACASLGDKGRNYAIPLHQHDYQNLISCSPLQQRRPARRNHSVALSNCRTSRTNRNRQDGGRDHIPNVGRHDKKTMKEDKFYEICLGHLCWQMEAGNSAAGTGLGFDRWISIFSLQKHQDELIQLSANPSSPSASSPANHRKHSHHQPQSHQPGGKRQSQRHHSTGGISSRQGSQENNNCKFFTILF